jgi:hypothetical protein
LHCPLTHAWVETQCESVVQLVRHPVPLQTYGAQLVVVPVWHVPVPSQSRRLVCVEPEQLCATHDVP